MPSFGAFTQVHRHELGLIAREEQAVGEGGLGAAFATEDLGAGFFHEGFRVGGHAQEFAAVGGDEEVAGREDDAAVRDFVGAPAHLAGGEFHAAQLGPGAGVHAALEAVEEAIAAAEDEDMKKRLGETLKKYEAK